jgi:hypothetical protein
VMGCAAMWCLERLESRIVIGIRTLLTGALAIVGQAPLKAVAGNE